MARLPVFERPLLRVLSGQETAEQFQVLDAVVSKKAPILWNVFEENSLIRATRTDDYRLDQLNSVLQKIPNLEPKLKNWRTKKNAGSAGKIMLDEMKFKVDIPLDDFELPVTALQLFDVAGINKALMDELFEVGDPKLAVIKRFEDWRIRYTAAVDPENPEYGPVTEMSRTTGEPVSAKDVERGYRAFEHFMFAADSTGFLKKLNAVSVKYLVK